MLSRRLLPMLPALAALAALATTAGAQRSAQSTQDWLDDCRTRWGRDDDRERACEVRDITIPARGRLTVSGGANGGVSVHGWERNEIRVVAKLQSSARSRADAEALLRDVDVRTGTEVRAEGPRTGRNESWSVSFEVYVPRRTDLALDANNGGIAIEEVSGAIRFSTVNGGVALGGLAGDVRGSTQNGGLSVTLTGTRWDGAGLDVRTDNGGVNVNVPSRYNADFETGTVNGGMNIDFPVTVSGRIGRTIETRLGAGGAPIRVRTTNGGVRVRQS